MKMTGLNALFVGVLIAVLAPLFLEAKPFGYIGFKAGVSDQILPKSYLTISNGVGMNKGFLPTISSLGLSLGISAGWGYEFNSDFGMRIEAQYIHQFKRTFKTETLKDQKGNPMPSDDPMKVTIQTEIHSLLGNLYFDYSLTPFLSLYASTGVGMGALSPSTAMRYSSNGKGDNYFPPTKKSLIWQVGFGFLYLLRENVSLDFNVRYVHFDRKAILLAQIMQAKIHAYYLVAIPEASIGLNYRF